jgi:uncharacterized protein (TIGR03435 family)
VFEVASVRPAAPLPPNAGPAPAFLITGGPGTRSPERITYLRTPLIVLIKEAYGVELDQIVGPGWLYEEKYTILATVPRGTPKDQVRTMLQNLLAERFRLTFHLQKKEYPVYTLAIAKGGPKLNEAAFPDATPLRVGQYAPLDRDGFPDLPPDVRGSMASSVSGVARRTFRSYSIEDLRIWLGFQFGKSPGPGTSMLGRVIDKTSLTGRYDFRLECAEPWGGSFSVSKPADDPLSRLDLPPDPGGSGPTIFAALEKQLGLKLEEAKAWLDVLVIDSALRVPIEN